MSEQKQQIYEFDGFRLDVPNRELRRDGTAVPLAAKAFDMLVVLIENGGRLIEKDDLLSRVWPDQIVEESNLTVQISAIRKALGDRKEKPHYIATIPGHGYRFTGNLVNLRRETRTLNNRSSSAPIKSIAVLPFKPLVASDRDESFEMGMTDTLITRLSRIGQLNVRPTSAVRQYTKLEDEVERAGRALMVDAVLDGSIQKSGDRIRVGVRLVRVAEGQTLWTEQFHEESSNIFAVQDAISHKVAAALAVKLGGEEMARLGKRDTDSPEAYELYLKGRYFWNKFTADDHRKATGYFNQAIAKDPGYAVAYVGLADTYGASATNGWLRPDEAYPKAKLTVQKALSLDDTLAEAHSNLGALFMFYDFDWVSAEREYRRAIELNPDYEGSYEVYSYLLCALGRPDEGAEKARRGLQANPLSSSLGNDLGLAYYLARRYDEAIKQFQKTLEMEPTRAESLLGLGTVYEQKGLYEEAINQYQKAIKSWGRTSPVLAQLGHAYSLSGNRKQALNTVGELKEMSRHSFRGSYDLAILYTGLGERDKAFEQLNKAYEERSGWIINLKVEPQFESLRADPRYASLLKRLNLPL